jgi:hypothetical protein
MATYRLQLDRPRPFFAEIPYYLWGQVNYDSEGDCKKPTDRQWTWMYLQHRGTQEVIDIKQDEGAWFVEGNDETAGRLVLFLAERCGATTDLAPAEPGGAWDHAAALLRASRVASEFEQPALAPFDSHLFWGSWKWIGWYATEFTWVGRWIMHSVVRNDPRGIPLCIDWLKAPPRSPQQEVALCYAVQRLSGEPTRGGREWVRWYEGDWFSKGAKFQYPEPNFDAWLAELKAEFGGES